MPVYDAKSGHGLHSPPPSAAASPKRLTKVAYLQSATEPVWAQNSTAYQPNFIRPIITLVPPRRVFGKTVKALSLTLQTGERRLAFGRSLRTHLALWLGLAWPAFSIHCSHFRKELSSKKE